MGGHSVSFGFWEAMLGSHRSLIYRYFGLSGSLFCMALSLSSLRTSRNKYNLTLLLWGSHDQTTASLISSYASRTFQLSPHIALYFKFPRKENLTDSNSSCKARLIKDQDTLTRYVLTFQSPTVPRVSGIKHGWLCSPL